MRRSGGTRRLVQRRRLIVTICGPCSGAYSSRRRKVHRDHPGCPVDIGSQKEHDYSSVHRGLRPRAETRVAQRAHFSRVPRITNDDRAVDSAAAGRAESVSAVGLSLRAGRSLNVMSRTAATLSPKRRWCRIVYPPSTTSRDIRRSSCGDDVLPHAGCTLVRFAIVKGWR
jgi:hypothetical protein